MFGKKRVGVLSSSFWKTWCMPWHYQIKLTPKQIQICQKMTAWLQKFYKIVSIWKNSNWWRQMLVASQLSRNKFLVIVVNIYTEADFKVSWHCPFLAWFSYLLPNILSKMVGVYYSWEYIVNVSDSIKTKIISVASTNADYTKKHLKISHQKT